YQMAVDELQAVKRRQKELEGQRTGIVGPLNTAVKAINALFAGPMQLLEQAEQILKTRMLSYQELQAAAAEAARREAEARAEAERRRIEAEAAEAARIAAEHAAAAKAAAAQGDMQAAAVSQAAAERAAAEAQTAVDTAQMVVAAPVMAPAVTPVKARGISTSSKLDFEVQDLAKLVAFIATGDGDKPLARPDLLGLVVADSVKLRAMVKALGAQANLPGVRVFEAKVMSARAA
ncbi:MAG: hypothetical protein MUC74_16590, partial [Ideonella sp.]|nr:hypothetical protein [Ideonella sp.]